MGRLGARLALPLVRGERGAYPQKPLCPICRRNKVFEPHSFAVLAAGALMEVRRGNSVLDDRLRGFLSLTWHGAHDGGSGRDPEAYIDLPIADDVSGGQAEL